MKITSIRINNSKKDGVVKAFASVCFDDAFVVHDIRVLQTKSGLVVAMPSNKINDKYVDAAHPVTTEFRSYLSSEVLKAYMEKATTEETTAETPASDQQ